MIKRFSDYDFKPYQEISLKAFGKLPNINTVTQENSKVEDMISRVENPEQFRPQRKRKERNSPKKLPIQKIHSNISKFLDGFEWESESEEDTEEESESESEMEQVPDVVENETPTPPENTQQSEIIEERIPTNL